MKSYRMAFSALALAVVAACAPNKNNSNSLQPGSVGVGPMGAGVDIKACQVGQIWNQTNGCMSRNSCQPGFGWTGNAQLQYQQQQSGIPVTNTGTCVAGQVVTEEIKFGYTAGVRYYGAINITNKAQFNVLMQYAGICTPYYQGFQIGMNGMNSVTCNTYTDRGGFVVMKAFGGDSSINSINLQVGAGTTVPYDLINVLPYTVYGQQSYVDSYQYRSFSQQGRLYMTNSNTGMTVAGVDSSGNDVGVALVVPTGNLGGQTITGQLMFQGIAVADVTMTKY